MGDRGDTEPNLFSVGGGGVSNLCSDEEGGVSNLCSDEEGGVSNLCSEGGSNLCSDVGVSNLLSNGGWCSELLSEDIEECGDDPAEPRPEKVNLH